MTHQWITGTVIFVIGLFIWIYLVKAFFLGIERETSRAIQLDSKGDPVKDVAGYFIYARVFEYRAYEFKSGESASATGMALVVGLLTWCSGWIPLFYR